jgi:hypothetical protein
MTIRYKDDNLCNELLTSRLGFAINIFIGGNKAPNKPRKHDIG